MPYSKIADTLKISNSTARAIVRNYEDTGRIGRKKGLWPKRVTVFGVRQAIDESLKANPFLKGKELRDIVYQLTGKALGHLLFLNDICHCVFPPLYCTFWVHFLIGST